MKKKSTAESTQCVGVPDADNPSLIEFSDGRIHDPVEVLDITQNWIIHHMKSRDNEFTIPQTANIFCGTWNVNAKKQDGSLIEWLFPESMSGQAVPDIYVVGFQEIVDLNAMNVALNSANTEKRSLFWQEEIEKSLQSTRKMFNLVASKSLVGLLLCVYAQESLLNNIQDIRVTSAAVGIMGMLGNKGGVSIRFSLYDTPICFVCAHLAAHRDNVSGRNADFHNILQRTVFPSEIPILRKDSTANGVNVIMPKTGAATYFSRELTILDHDLVFWIGDLNYRIDEDVSTEEVFFKIETKDLQFLKEKDQLNIERGKNAVFQGFVEGDLKFPPTYKFQPGTDLYEMRAEKKLRAPAWCDRILWKIANPKSTVRQLQYESACLLPSDHKPVSALFSCSVRKVVEAQERSVFKELMKTLDNWVRYPDAVPTVEITGLQVSVDKLYYEVPHEELLVIKNTSETIAHWHFVPKLEDVAVSKSWIAFDKTSGLLLPFETVAITMTLKVDRMTAQDLNVGIDSLNDLIVLRVEKSHDRYVSVCAEYERSCYGVNLEELIRTTVPLRQTKLPTVDSSITSRTDVKPLPVPKELWRLVDALSTTGTLKEKNLFVEPGTPSEALAIREALDCGTSLPSCSPHSLAEALTSLFKAFPYPVVPIAYYPQTEVEDTNVNVHVRRLSEDLPAANYNAFAYLVAFMRQVLTEKDYNRSSIDLLATVVLDCITPMPAVDFMPFAKDEKRRLLTKRHYMLLVLSNLLL